MRKSNIYVPNHIVFRMYLNVKWPPSDNVYYVTCYFFVIMCVILYYYVISFLFILCYYKKFLCFLKKDTSAVLRSGLPDGHGIKAHLCQCACRPDHTSLSLPPNNYYY